jgi:hypothetical protein
LKNTDDDTRKLVRIQNVVREVKHIGHFALYAPDSENLLLITDNFVLNMLPEQFWKVQCKLEAKEVGKWYSIINRTLCEDKDTKLTDESIAWYFDLLHRGADLLTLSKLCIMDALDVVLYTDSLDEKIGIDRDYLHMFRDWPMLQQPIDSGIEEYVIASDYHVLRPVPELESDYLKHVTLIK